MFTSEAQGFDAQGSTTDVVVLTDVVSTVDSKSVVAAMVDGLVELSYVVGAS